jgi:hypothetical protein
VGVEKVCPARDALIRAGKAGSVICSTNGCFDIGIRFSSDILLPKESLAQPQER